MSEKPKPVRLKAELRASGYSPGWIERMLSPFARMKRFAVVLHDEAWDTLDSDVSFFVREIHAGKAILCDELHFEGPLATLAIDGREKRIEFSFAPNLIKSIYSAKPKPGFNLKNFLAILFPF